MMIDYCLMKIFILDDICSFKIFGDYVMHPKINNILSQKIIEQNDQPDLIIIYEENYAFIQYYINNILSNKIKYLIVKTKTKDDAIFLFKEFRSIGDSFISTQQKTVIIKNIKNDFKTEFRKQILMPIEKQNLDHFLKLETENKYTDYEIIPGEQEHQIIKSITTNTPYIYVGQNIPEKTINFARLLCDLKLKLVEIVDDNDEFIGMMFTKDFTEKAWIIKLTQSQQLKEFFKLSENYFRILICE